VTAKKLLALAAADIGYTESPPNSNRQKYGVWYGWNGVAWCMMAVQYWYAMAGVPLPYKTASCSNLLEWYEKWEPARVIRETAPEPGDIAIFTFGHTGIVESHGGDTVTCIEGNTSPGDSGSQDNGGGVYRRTRPRRQVEAFLRPVDFAEPEDEMTQEQFENMLHIALERRTAGPVPAWAEAEYARAVAAGLTDGTDPLGIVPRYQAAIMALRALEAADAQKE